MVASRPFPSLGLHSMKLQVWIKVQTEQIAWSNVLTGTLSAGHSRYGRVEEAMPLPSSGDALGPSSVNSKLMGEQDGKLGDVKFLYSYKKQVEGKSPEGMQLSLSLPIFISISPASLYWPGNQPVGTFN